MFQRLRRLLSLDLHDPMRRFQLSVMTLLFLTGFATIGYMVFEEMTLLDALYMTVITITTVGFGEIQPLSTEGRIFTILVILLGVSAATTAISNAVGMVLGPRLWFSIRQRHIKRELMKMNQHYIVCGYGRMGRQVSADLQKRGEPFVIIENSEDNETYFVENNIPYVIGDATRDETLLEAGIKQARGLVASLDTDPDNVMTVLTARELNAKLFIVARVSRSETETKLIRAGANRVVSPYQIGGHRIALALMRPAVNDFLDSIFHFERGLAIDIGQVTIYDGSPLAGKTLATSGLRDTYRVNILAIQSPDGEMHISPVPAQVIEVGSTVIIIGPPEGVYALEQAYLNQE